MSAVVGTFEIGLDTPIHMLTPRQLFEMQREWMERDAPKKPSRPEEQLKAKWHVHSMDDLAAALGTSRSTAYRMKAEGLLDEAISQYGRWMCIDVEKVLEKFRLSNLRRRKRQNQI